MKRKIIWVIILMLLVLVALPSCAPAEEMEEIDPVFEESAKVIENSLGVILIPIDFKEDRWFLGEGGVQVLPCSAPSPFQIGEVGGPLIRVLGSDNQVVYTTNLPMDPRIILFEGPSEKSNILEEVSIFLKVPLLKDMQSLEFFVKPEAEEDTRRGKPDVQVDLLEAIKIYEEQGGMEQSAECQEFIYTPNALKK